ncbi:hypothetical protein CEXT_3471 [Caerostris extrusa]|uniref:Uncharacterized protein n=1 Tax=Caerostris extrusa TaxID=172846 RepID=A0AAV4QFD8_CAEEX|nr:hypothetical protein CEXT_3471 [Caerostris extrusa]
MRPSKKNVSFRLRGKREIVEFGDSSTFYDTIFRNSLPATKRNDPLCRKFQLLDKISREIGKSHSERENEKRNTFLSKMERISLRRVKAKAIKNSRTLSARISCNPLRRMSPFASVGSEGSLSLGTAALLRYTFPQQSACNGTTHCAKSYYEQPDSLWKDIVRPLKKNVSFRLPEKREFVKFGDSTFHDTLFPNQAACNGTERPTVPEIPAT